MPEIIKQNGYNLQSQSWGRQIVDGHLGGCSAEGDPGTYYPLMWEYMVDHYNIKSVLDVGCGVGFSAKFFQDLGCEVLGIDGAAETKELSLIRDFHETHDYTNGSFFNGEPKKKFDLAWSCEFVEHVEEQYAINFINDYKNCKYVAITHAIPGQGGHHHVNEQHDSYWIELLEKNGFTYLPEETLVLRAISFTDKEATEFNGTGFLFYFNDRGLFFINNNFN
jgi:SAM-dependent methyltransferase